MAPNSRQQSNENSQDQGAGQRYQWKKAKPSPLPKQQVFPQEAERDKGPTSKSNPGSILYPGATQRKARKKRRGRSGKKQKHWENDTSLVQKHVSTGERGRGQKWRNASLYTQAHTRAEARQILSRPFFFLSFSVLHGTAHGHADGWLRLQPIRI